MSIIPHPGFKAIDTPGPESWRIFIGGCIPSTTCRTIQAIGGIEYGYNHGHLMVSGVGRDDLFTFLIGEIAESGCPMIVWHPGTSDEPPFKMVARNGKVVDYPYSLTTGPLLCMDGSDDVSAIAEAENFILPPVLVSRNWRTITVLDTPGLIDATGPV